MRFRFGDHSLDTDRRELRRGGELVALEPQVFDLLVYLVQNRDRVVSKDDVLEAVWGGRIVSESALTSRLTAVRRAIDDTGGAQRLIRTVPRKGIRFIGVVHEEAAAAPASSGAPRLAIVVLPFVNLSSDPELEYFADGITDDLTTDLSRIAGSFVIARSTAFTYKGKATEVKQIGRELSVRYVLEGSVRRAGDRVQVNVQLIDADSGGHLWADRVETDRRDLAEGQREITGRLARTLNLELIEDIARRIEQENATDPDAKDLVMLGEAGHRRWLRSTGRDRTQSLHEAQRCFERALAKDSGSIDARIGIARVLVSYLLFGWSTSDQQDGARAGQLLLEAIEADPNRSIAYACLGQLRRLQNRLSESRIALENAIAIDPNDVTAHLQLGWTLLFLGEPAAGLTAGADALWRSPHDPRIRGVHLLLAWCHLLLNQAAPAIEQLTRSIAGRPRYWVNHIALAAALGLADDFEGAKAALAESLIMKPEVNSLAQLRACRPWGNAEHWALFEETAAAGLRRVGFPDQ
jgi:adenylate cyclase